MSEKLQRYTTGRICSQCGMRLTSETPPSCDHCGWEQGQPVDPLPGQGGDK